MRQISALIKQKCSEEGEVQVVPVWGNHGVTPNDQFSWENKGPRQVLEEVAEIWRDFLDEEAYEQFKATGYYAMGMKQRKARFIALNSMLYDALNFYLF